MRQGAARAWLAALVLSVAPAVMAHGDVEARIEKLSKKFADEPSADLLVRRARLYLEEGHAAEAKRDLGQALQLAPEKYESWYYLSQAERLLGDPAAAVAAADRFLQAADSLAARGRGHVLRGDALSAAGLAMAAGEAYVAAIDLQTEPNPEHFLLAADAFRTARSPRALELLDRGIRQIGPLATLQDRALMIEIESGRYEAALARVEAMLVAGQRRPQLLHQKGRVLRLLGRNEAAMETFRAALVELQQLPENRRRTRAAQQLRERIEQDLGAA